MKLIIGNDSVNAILKNSTHVPVINVCVKVRPYCEYLNLPFEGKPYCCANNYSTIIYFIRHKDIEDAHCCSSCRIEIP